MRLPSLAKAIAYGTAVFGTYANWLFTALAAIFGTAANTPIASEGRHGRPWQETLVGAGFLSVAISMIGFGVFGPERSVMDRHEKASAVDLAALHAAMADGTAAEAVTQTETIGRKYGVQTHLLGCWTGT